MLETELVPKHEGSELPSALREMPRGDLLLGYQQRAIALLSASDLVVIEKSRRIGLTWALAAHAVLTAAAQRAAGGKDVLYISYAHDMTREFVDACAMWAKAFMNVSVAIDDQYLFNDADEHGNTKEIKAFRIDFASGFSIVGLPGVPRALRGRQGLVFIDEAAFVDSLKELLKAAIALLMWGGQVVVVSTHNGAENAFNQLLEDVRSKEREGAVLKITFDDALDDGLYERICLVTGKTPSAEGKIEFVRKIRASYGDAASEELDCVPSLGAGSLLSMEKIMACTHKDAGKPELYAGGLVTVGRDIAIRKTGDLSVIVAAELVGSMLWTREEWSERGASFRKQDEEQRRMFAAYRVLRAGIDQTGMGEKVVEDAQAEYGQRVEGVLFSAPNRLDLALALAKRVDDQTIVLPDDPKLRKDLRAIKKVKGTGTQVRIVDDGEVHADKFWAYALAAKMADVGPIEIGHGTTGEKRQGFSAFGDKPLATDMTKGFGIVRSPNQLDRF